MLLKAYCIPRKLGYVGIEKIMVSFTRNDYEPDLCFFRQEIAQHFHKGQMLFPVPDLAVEILSSNVKHDRIVKYKDYEAHAVSEYWIVDAEKEAVEQYILVNGKYQLQANQSDAHISSHVVQGFKIPIRAIFDEEIAYSTLLRLVT